MDRNAEDRIVNPALTSVVLVMRLRLAARTPVFKHPISCWAEDETSDLNVIAAGAIQLQSLF